MSFLYINNAIFDKWGDYEKAIIIMILIVVLIPTTTYILFKVPFNTNYHNPIKKEREDIKKET